MSKKAEYQKSEIQSENCSKSIQKTVKIFCKKIHYDIRNKKSYYLFVLKLR